jgi:hypothetical protein
LIVKNTLFTAMEFSRCARTASAQPEQPDRHGRSLKTQQRTLLTGSD